MSSRLSSPRIVTLWLTLCTLLVLLMIVVGGYTRLSGSGLSMVDWQPVAGILPPLSDTAWQAEFDRYKAFPEYQQVNTGMSLAGFKRIYLVEYAHRILGRTIGLVFFVPFVLLMLFKKLRRPLSLRLGVVFLLGGLQALLGWYMVKSGLVDQPHVSQYRLTAHLSLAVLLFGYLLWLTLNSWRVERDASREDAGQEYEERRVVTTQRAPSRLATGFVVLTALMIVTGGFMAGTRAGYIHNTFPTISGSFFPAGLFSIEPWWRNLFENATTIQTIHRYLALVTLIFGAALSITVLRTGRSAWKLAAWLALTTLVAQILLGILTLIWRVPLQIALMHQFCAMCLLASAVFLAYRTRQT